MQRLDYFVILLFTIMILVVGLAFTRSGANMKSYFAAGGSLPWWLSGLSLFMSFFSAGTFVVWGSIAYDLGWVAITIQWMMALGGFFIGFYIAPKWRRAGVLTVGEYIGNRFGSGLEKFYSYIFLVLSFVTTGAFLYPVAKLFNVSSGLSIELSILILGCLIIVYTTAGGLWAVIITDVLQFIILFAAVLIVVPLAFDKTGGINSFLNQVPDDFFAFINGEYTFWFLVAFLFYNAIYIGGNWAYVQRYTSVANAKDAKKVGWLFGALYLISPILWMLPPMIYRTLDGGLGGLENEGAFMLMCKQVLPTGMLGLMLGGMIFATASSVNTTLNMQAAVFTNDIFKATKKPAKPNLMLVARISTVFFGLITIGVALMVPRLGGIVEVVLSVGAITGAPLFAPPIWSLFSNRQNSKSILTATLVSLAINLFFKFVSPWLLDFGLNRAEEMLVGVVTPLLILATFEFFNRRSKYTSLAMPIQEKRAISKALLSSQNYFAIKVLGISTSITGLLVLVLGTLANTGAWIVGAIGILILSVGVWLLRRGTKS
ncbi:MAG: sodium:solute symporter family protein [Cyclobacteriaceae bacterium]